MKNGLIYAFAFLFLVGVASAASMSSNSNGTLGCKNLYWIDDENKSCGQKEFCGAFMYYGLQTFDTKEDCFGASVNCAHLSCSGALYNETSKKCECGKAVNNSCIKDFDCGGTTCKEIDEMVQRKCVKGACVPTKECPLAEKQFFNLSNGRKAEIKIMPETASERAIERLGELNFTIELKEVGQDNMINPLKVVYELKSEKQGKMLGLFKVRANVSAEVDAETGDVLKVKKPWWAFLATGI